MSLSLFGIILGLVLLMFLAYKGYSIIWVAPVCAVVVAVLSGYAILDAYIGDYMKGMADYVLQWFPAFFLGAVYGKVMDLTGSARSLGNALVKLIGPRFAVAAVVIPCLLMTYGGISLFVVVFVIYPMGYSIYRAADLPRTLLPGAIATGAFGITMTAVPGTPQIQNLIPTDYYGTTTMAAPLLSLVACAVMLLPAYIYLEWRVRQSRRKGLHFVPDPKHKEVDHDSKALPSWHWVTGIVPLVVVVLMLNLFPWLLNRFAGIELASNYAIVIAGGRHSGGLPAEPEPGQDPAAAINEGANGSMGAIMNTACAVGFGSVVKVVPRLCLPHQHRPEHARLHPLLRGGGRQSAGRRHRRGLPAACPSPVRPGPQVRLNGCGQHRRSGGPAPHRLHLLRRPGHPAPQRRGAHPAGRVQLYPQGVLHRHLYHDLYHSAGILSGAGPDLGPVPLIPVSAYKKEAAS